MALIPGARLGPYEISVQIGVGGMGEVYRAADTNLKRQVAIKVLPAAVAQDAERLARFQREAEVLAALNHPHIAAIYGLEKTPEFTALVMELVEGDDLSQRIARSAIPVDEALPIARQIAEALEAAHEQGIVHRDLKPANIKVRPDGTVKVLDFGLAKAMEPVGAAAPTHVSQLPTITTPAMTQAGMILGTAAYMSPEQARGKPVDKRADIFAFGCVLYEMLTGRRAFEGDTVPDVLSRVLQGEPDWTLIPAAVPPGVSRLLQLCLVKDLKGRRQSAGDVRIDLERALVEPVTTVPARGSRGTGLMLRVSAGAAAVVAAALALPAVLHLRETPPPEMRLELVTPPSRRPLDFALSPNGRLIAFVGPGLSSEAPDLLYVRALDKAEGEPLMGAERARLPFWSPDGRSVGFFASGKLYRIDIAGGPPEALASASNPQGGAWNADGTILFAPDSVSPLFRVQARGGEAEAATKADVPGQTAHSRPSFLPDGRHFLYASGGSPDVAGLYLGSLDGDAPKRLAAGALSGGFPIGPDHIVFLRQGLLVEQAFEIAQGVLTDDPVTLAERVGGFSVSASGTIAYRTATLARTELAWFDRQGRALGSLAEVGFNGPELSPDGRRLVGDRTVAGNRDVWILDLVRGGAARVTTDAAIDGYPSWSPDGTRIVFESNRKGTLDLWARSASGASAEEMLLETPDNEWPIHWSRDGRFLLYQRSDLRTKWDLWALPMTGADRTPRMVATTAFAERMGEFSPDVRWVAYETDESGMPEVVVQAFPEADGRSPVSTGGGVAPRWSRDGKEIYFLAPDGKMMAAPVTVTGSTVEVGAPVTLFDTHIAAQTFRFQYAVSTDGRFLINQTPAETSVVPIHLILNLKP